ncbi:hypothetical protein JYB64_10790 [Algoriphagus aestuarii]|nr:hypothetical protein [Algoriphagus aestuarii]
MMEYLLKSMLCLVLLLLIHRLFLQREVMHQFNRFFLLGAVVFSFLIPFNSIEVAAEKEEITYSEFSESDFSNEFVLPEHSLLPETISVETAKTPDQAFPWNEVFWGIYSLITLVLLIRFIRNIKVLMDQVQQNLKVTYKGMTLVLLPKASLPYTFLKFVFVSKTDFENGGLADAIIEHEYTHVKEGHSYDIIFLEALLIPFWFHPGLYLAKQAIRLNHEFIADQKALKTTSLHSYQKMLLALASQEVRFSLVSNLNFSLTKKRLKMMKQQSNPFQKWAKLLVMIPVLGALVYVFSEKVTAHQEKEKAEQEEVFKSTEIDEGFTLKSDGSFVYQNENYQLSQLPGILEGLDKENTIINIIASSEVKMGVIQDFQRILRETGVNKVKYQSSTGEIQLAATKVFNLAPIVNNKERDQYYKNATFFVENESGDLEEKSYQMLSDEEKKMLSFFPVAPGASSPTLEEFESFKNPEDFAVWLDGKHIQNSELEMVKYSQIVHVFNSFVHANARSEKFPQDHQVHLYTEEGFEKTYGASSGFGEPLTKGDKLYLYPAENRVNRGKPWVKDAKSAVSVYQEMNDKYEKFRKVEPHFIQRSEEEQQKLQAQFSELGSLYFRIPLELKGTVSRPIHPFAPYLKLESDGNVYYKLAEDLTAEEKSQLPPPPSVSKDKVEAYHQLFLKYEWIRMEGRRYSNKTQEERAYMYELYNAMQDQYMAMNPIQRRQVKRVNYPFIPLNENGHLTFKVVDELTPEQRAFSGC